MKFINIAYPHSTPHIATNVINFLKLLSEVGFVVLPQVTIQNCILLYYIIFSHFHFQIEVTSNYSMWLVCAVYQQPSTIYEVQCTYLVRHLNNSEYGFSSVAKFGQISSSPECLVFSTNPQPERRGEADDVQDDFIIINSQISIPFHSHFFNFQFHQSHLHLLIYFPIAQTIGARKKVESSHCLIFRPQQPNQPAIKHPQVLVTQLVCCYLCVCVVYIIIILFLYYIILF